MPTLIPDPMPASLEEWMERRRRAGADRHDEMWNGVLHMSPEPTRAHLDIQQQLAELLGPLARASGLKPGIGAFNLGDSPDDYRAPDGGLFRDDSVDTFSSTAALVLEIVSPGDESWKKFDFYAAHHVDEVLIIDPHKRSVHWFTLAGDHYEPTDASALIELGPHQLRDRIQWPELGA